jgi:hypothetical protein
MDCSQEEKGLIDVTRGWPAEVRCGRERGRGRVCERGECEGRVTGRECERARCIASDDLDRFNVFCMYEYTLVQRPWRVGGMSRGKVSPPLYHLRLGKL